jgi:nucleotide-binding universal stress UspA family protein
MRIRRIVVAIDASPASVAALEAAAELAAALEAEVLGLFVEDINLLRLSSLPFAHEVGALSATRRRLSGVDMERQLRFQAERAREALAAVERRLGVRTSFRIARGTVAEQLINALKAEDLLSLGARGWASGRGLGSTARTVAFTSRGRVLILPHGARLTGPAAVLFDGSPSGVEALETALAIAGGRPRDVHVYCVAETEKDGEHLARQAADHLGPGGEGILYRQVKPKDLPRATPAIRTAGANTLVVPGSSDLIADGVIETVVTEFPGPALVVRVRE